MSAGIANEIYDYKLAQEVQDKNPTWSLQFIKPQAVLVDCDSGNLFGFGQIIGKDYYDCKSQLRQVYHTLLKPGACKLWDEDFDWPTLMNSMHT